MKKSKVMGRIIYKRSYFTVQFLHKGRYV